MTLQAWTVNDAKTYLSEILRRAQTGEPQRIGTENSCIVISADQWEHLTGWKPRLGQWLISHLAGTGELNLPDRLS